MRRKLPRGGLGDWEIRLTLGKAPVAACFGSLMIDHQFTLDFPYRLWEPNMEIRLRREAGASGSTRVARLPIASAFPRTGGSSLRKSFRHPWLR